MQQQSLSLSYDAYPSPTKFENLDQNLIQRFFDQVNSRGRITLIEDMQTNLIKLKLIRDNRVTIAASLLFGDPDFSIRIGRFKSPDTIIDDLVVQGSLFGVLNEALTFIKKHINLSYSFDCSLQRIERWQYPLEALRELLLNCMIHRDYKNFSDIIIKIFDDKIVFTNPGNLYGNLRVEDIKRDDYTSAIRNKLLAEAFYLTGDIERYGTGIVRIRKALLDYPELAFSFEEMGGFFKVDLQIINTVTPQVTPQVTKILQLLQGRKELSRNDIQKLLTLKDREHMRRNYLTPAIDEKLVTMSKPDHPRAADQRYRLTSLGEAWCQKNMGAE